MTHPLAQKAAEKIAQAEREWKGGYGTPTPDYPAIIHTTAVEPILKAGEGLEKYAVHRPVCSINFGSGLCDCGFNQALAEWRRVKGE